MNAKTKFMHWARQLKAEQRADLVWMPYGEEPRSLNVVMIEVVNDTELGDRLLEELGFKGDE